MDQVLILDFGSQYTQLIARRVREMEVYCEILPYHRCPVEQGSWKAVILSGSPSSTHDPEAPVVPWPTWFEGVPVLGICYGAQWLAANRGGSVARSVIREYGRAVLQVQGSVGSPLLEGLSEASQVWMSHGDTIVQLPTGARCIASTETVANAAFEWTDRPLYGIQFHPEVTHSQEGFQVLKNFVLKIAGLQPTWTADSFVRQAVQQIRDQVVDQEVVMGISGGVDSTVAAVLLHQAIGERLHGVFVDNGLLRLHEYQEVLQAYRDLGLSVRGVDARHEFYRVLAGLTDPEAKRKAIGAAFIACFEKEAGSMPKVAFLGQGTIYPDVIESVSVHGPSATIKSHHNVGGLPERMKLSLVEPLRNLFKDEVRKVGRALNIPDVLLDRHPFPGPGLGIRILGEVNAESVALLQEADAIYMDHLRRSGWYSKIWQAGAILLPVRSVGVMGDERSYERVLALRAVHSVDGMTADWVHLPYELLAEISNDIINKVRGINRVVYDISSKPPATIEWE
ncbi:MAG: glutamine-hydrolyzing synthase [Bacteroidota bacterium]|jgi:GMP synthase (glutamine-hydrolysing)|nr:glutamine-hydrolyzing GMP synthase [Bacteroidota bacterium]